MIDYVLVTADKPAGSYELVHIVRAGQGAHGEGRESWRIITHNGRE
jgi:hypothetical protein